MKFKVYEKPTTQARHWWAVEANTPQEAIKKAKEMYGDKVATNIKVKQTTDDSYGGWDL